MSAAARVILGLLENSEPLPGNPSSNKCFVVDVRWVEKVKRLAEGDPKELEKYGSNVPPISLNRLVPGEVLKQRQPLTENVLMRADRTQQAYIISASAWGKLKESGKVVIEDELPRRLFKAPDGSYEAELLPLFLYSFGLRVKNSAVGLATPVVVSRHDPMHESLAALAKRPIQAHKRQYELWVAAERRPATADDWKKLWSSSSDGWEVTLGQVDVLPRVAVQVVELTDDEEFPVSEIADGTLTVKAAYDLWEQRQPRLTRMSSSSSLGVSSDDDNGMEDATDDNIAILGGALKGLQNLRNTCYMNSALQCLIRTMPLTEYFLRSEYQRDINVDNPLGTKGELARAYAKLLRQMYSRVGPTTVVPKDLKKVVGAFAPNFNNSFEQDSQEFTAFLLDGLHEDLNRLRQKMYYENSLEGDDSCNQEKLAEESWKRHLSRNDSVIVELFQGQYRNRLECPHCRKVSITYDPFMYLTVPIPSRTSFNLHIRLSIPSDKVTMLGLQIRASTENTFLSAARVVAAELVRTLQLDNDLSVAMESVIGNLDNPQLEEHLAQRILVSNYDSESWHDASRFTTQFLCEEAFLKPPNYAASASSANAYLLPLDSKFGTAKNVVQFLEREQQSATTGELPLFVDWVADSSEAGEYSVRYTPTFIQTKMLIASASITCGKFRALLSVPQAQITSVILKRDATAILPEDPNMPLLDFLNKKIPHQEWKEPLQFLVRLSTVYTPGRAGIWTKISADSSVHAVTLEECLSRFFCTETLSDSNTWYCNRCKDHVRAERTFSLWKAPPILVIQLKRFSQLNRWQRAKNSAAVAVSENKPLDLSAFLSRDGRTPDGRTSNPSSPTSSDQSCIVPIYSSPDSCEELASEFLYDLQGVSNHSGTLAGGHYTATVKCAIGKEYKWYEFNDTWVSPSRGIDQKSAYLLFFQRRATFV